MYWRKRKENLTFIQR